MKYLVVLLFAIATLGTASSAFAETRSAKDMQKECRVALDVLQKKVEPTFQNTLFAGECVGYVQGAADTSMTMADNVKWYKICVPDSTSTLELIQNFIEFVDHNPKIVLASTAILTMLAQQYPCRNK
jgi:Rap1a immunity proteins